MSKLTDEINNCIHSDGEAMLRYNSKSWGGLNKRMSKLSSLAQEQEVAYHDLVTVVTMIQALSDEGTSIRKICDVTLEKYS